MPKINLRSYYQPSHVEALVNIKTTSGDYERYTMIVDTGAEVSLLPIGLLNKIEHHLTDRNAIVITQAGIAKQSFSAQEAMITLFLEDFQGNRTSDLTVRVWFADTLAHLLGFEGVLDQAFLGIDMLRTKTAWLEF